MASVKLPKLHSDFFVDCVIFGFNEGKLKVLLTESNELANKNHKALPGGLAKVNENMDQAAQRMIYQATGLENVLMEQLHTFGSIKRHSQGSAITVAYYAVIKSSVDGLLPASGNASWYPINKLPVLAFDHNEIIEKAIARLKNRLRYLPIGFELLPEKFTLSQLQHVYESILKTSIDKRNFRKKLMSYGLLTPLQSKEKGVAHRAAQLFKFNKSKYQQLQKKGYYFEP